eukprot:753691-Hanusia_phi.AAC.1
METSCDAEQVGMMINKGTGNLLLNANTFWHKQDVYIAAIGASKNIAYAGLLFVNISVYWKEYLLA